VFLLFIIYCAGYEMKAIIMKTKSYPGHRESERFSACVVSAGGQKQGESRVKVG